MDNYEKDEYISSMSAYMHSLKDHPIMRRRLFMDAGIIDASGDLMEMRKSDESIAE
jgi:hypothetical protein